jgi:phosphatidylglycerol:prolipoprotein diacylglycerol transferase
MRIELFHIGGFSVHGYGFMIGVGFLIALMIGCFRAKRLGLEDEAVIDIAILAGICGFAGAKVLYVIISFKDFIKSPMSVLGSSGFVVYGGIIAGVLAAAIYCKIKKLSFLQYFDLVMPEVAIAQGFGRLGCFLAGCCYGRATDAWFGVTFPSGSMAPSGVSLIPTQLFSAAGDFVIAAVLLVAAGNMRKSGKQYFDGSVGCLYLVLYGIGRFIIEFFRNDYRGAVGFLSTSQFISVFIVASGITRAIYLNKMKKTNV